MIENYISENITYLIDTSKDIFTQDEFGNLFELNRGAINSYVKKKAVPKLETIQRICKHYKISIDDFVNRNLSVIEYSENDSKMTVNEPPEGYGIFNLKYVNLLEKTIEDKEIIINQYKEKYENDSNKSKQA